jgi:parallel beta-helix repeat protein
MSGLGSLARAGARRLRSLGPFDVLVLSAPLVFALAYALGASLIDYRTTLQFDDPWARGRRLESFLSGRLRTAVMLPKAVSLRQRMDPEVEDAGIVRLRVGRDAWEVGVADPFISSPAWVDATLLREGAVTDVRVRRRGDTSLHWTTPKVSFTLRTPRGEHVRGFRELAFSGKAVLSAHVANSIPGEFELDGSFSAVVPVNPYIWDRTAESDAPGSEGFAPLHDLLRAVSGSTFEEHLRLMSLVDRDEIARLLAALLVVGDPYHMSGVHNQLWYEDPSTGLFHPIAWDLRLLDLQTTEARLNDFLQAVLRDPFVVDRTLGHLRAAIEGNLYKRTAERLTAIAERYEPYLEFERVRQSLVSDPGSPEAILDQLRRNLATLAGWIADARTRYAAVSASTGEIVLDFETSGFGASDLLAVRIEGWSGDPERLRLLADLNGDGLADPTDAAIQTRVEPTATGVVLRLVEPAPLLAAWRAGDTGIRRARQHYRFFLLGSRDLEPDSLSVTLVNRHTGEALTPELVARGTALGGAEAWHPWRYPRRTGQTVRLAGTVNLRETLVVQEEDRLVIEPGTTILLEPDVSILSFGRVVAMGRPDRRIRIEGTGGDRPWGALVLQGPAADSSTFEHVDFSGGGGARLGRVDYKGMVSVHWARGVRFENVSFEDNRRSDDALNAVHADVTLEGCAFRRANGDAVDFDYSSGSIVGCSFEASRNDAIDLMGSSPLIASNRIAGSGDKGISIGERSNPRIVNNHIMDSVRGIEIKDRSEPVILHSTIERNGIGVLAQVKNWRYAGGGRATLLYSRVTGNESDLQVDESSFSTLYETQVGDAPLETHDPAGWIHPSVGVAVPSPRAGTLSALELADPAPPRWVESFDRPFDQTPAPWVSRGLARFRRGDDALLAWAERVDGTLERPVDWDLRETAGNSELVIEFRARDIDLCRLILVSEAGETVAELDLGTDPRVIDMVTVDVPPGLYRTLRLQITPHAGVGRVDPRSGLVEQRGGRFELRRLRLFTLAGDSDTPGGGES